MLATIPTTVADTIQVLIRDRLYILPTDPKCCWGGFTRSEDRTSFHTHTNVTTPDRKDHLEGQDDKVSDTLTAKDMQSNWGATLPQQEGEEKMTSATSMTTPYCECGQCSSAEEDNAKTEEFKKKTVDLKKSNADLLERARSLQSQLKHLVKVYQEHSPQGDQPQAVPKDLLILHEEPQDEPAESKGSQEV